MSKSHEKHLKYAQQLREAVDRYFKKATKNFKLEAFEKEEAETTKDILYELAKIIGQGNIDAARINVKVLTLEQKQIIPKNLNGLLKLNENN